MNLHISTHNSKIGRVMNLSLPPIVTCRQNTPCASACYALKAWRQYPQTRTAWSDNLTYYQADPAVYFAGITERIADRCPELFRWHVAGDCPDWDYFCEAVEVARLVKRTRFLMFTKRYDFLSRLVGIGINLADFAPNFTVVASAWPGLEMPKAVRRSFPVAWMQDGREDRMRGRVFPCTGFCETCKTCWGLSAGQSVLFNLH